MFSRNPESSDNLDWRLLVLLLFSAAATYLASSDMPSLSLGAIAVVRLFAAFLSLVIILSVLACHWNSMVNFTRLTTYWRVFVIFILFFSNVFIGLGVSSDSGMSLASVLSLCAVFYAMWSMLAEMFLEKFFSSKPRKKTEAAPINHGLRRYAVKFWIVLGLRLLSGATIGDTRSPYFSGQTAGLLLLLDTVIAIASLIYLAVISYKFLKYGSYRPLRIAFVIIGPIFISFIMLIIFAYLSQDVTFDALNGFQVWSLLSYAFTGLFVWWFQDSSPKTDIPSVAAMAAVGNPLRGPHVVTAEATGSDLDEPRSHLLSAAGSGLAQEATVTAETQGSTRRRGWTLPDPRQDSGDPQRQPEAYPASEPSRPFSGQQIPVQTMAGAIAGQVIDVEQATLQSGQMSMPIVTLRLERNDPHKGRTFVANVRLNGANASGFADVGDWIEAIGRQNSTFLFATRCVNHTTHAVYDNNGLTVRWPWLGRGLKVVSAIARLRTH